MPPRNLGLVALVDQVHSHLEHGDYAGHGPLRFGGGECFEDAELAARVLLADVEHCSDLEQASPGRMGVARWAALMEDLRLLQGVLAR